MNSRSGKDFVRGMRFHRPLALLLFALPCWAAAQPNPSASAPTSAPQLLDVRLRPLGDSLRIIFPLTNQAAYSVKSELASRRVRIDFIGAEIRFLPPELNRVGLPWLDGIWLASSPPGIATLELRLPSPRMRITHFALTDPPAVVIDLFREDQPWVHTTVASDGPLPAVRLPASDEDRSSSASASLGNSPVAQEPVNEIRLIDADYDYFPISQHEFRSAEANEVLDDFLARRWAHVVRKGIEYLKTKPINPDETGFLLHLVAEARWRLGRDTFPQPLDEMRNYYEQALRVAGAGDLGAFAHWRLAQLAGQMHDFDRALQHLRQAAATSQPAQQLRVELLRVQALRAARKTNPALKQIQALLAGAALPNGVELSNEQRVELLLDRGDILTETGQFEAAWQAYQEARKIDPAWLSLNPDSGELMALAAAEIGELTTARQTLEYINQHFSYREDERKVALALQFADVLERLGDLDAAEGTYAALLAELGDTPKGAAVERRMLKVFPDRVVGGETRYCRLLWRRGKLTQAMTELDRVWNLCLREGISTEPLRELVGKIVPDFIAFCARHDQPFAAVQAWNLYQASIGNSAARQSCMPPLIESLALLNLNDEALRQLLLYEQHATADAEDSARLALLKAQLLSRLERTVEAIELIEKNLARIDDPDQSAKALRLLAEAYSAEDRPLEAAQAWQALAEVNPADSTTVGEASLRAGEIFLEQAMPLQAMEIGLKALFHEQQHLDQGLPVTWAPEVRDGLLLMLAKAYRARGDQQRALILLDEYLARPSITAGEAAFARRMVAECHREAGRLDASRAAYEAILADERAPAPWPQIARRALDELSWNEQNPQWSIPRPQRN